MTETEIIKGCLEGNPRAQHLLVKEHAAFLLGICRRYLYSVGYEEDALQESWIKIFQHLKNFRSDGPIRAWMRQITIHTCISLINQNKKNQAQAIEDSHSNIRNATMDSLDSLSEMEMIALIHSLPKGYREVFNLYIIDGYSHAEIAKILGCAESNSRSQLSRARQLLQEKFEKLNHIQKHNADYEKHTA